MSYYNWFQTRSDKLVKGYPPPFKASPPQIAKPPLTNPVPLFQLAYNLHNPCHGCKKTVLFAGPLIKMNRTKRQKHGNKLPRTVK